MALGWVVLAIAARPGGAWESNGVLFMAQAGIQINLVLMALNLLPIPPLDGDALPSRCCPGVRRMRCRASSPPRPFHHSRADRDRISQRADAASVPAAGRAYLLGAIVGVFAGGQDDLRPCSLTAYCRECARPAARTSATTTALKNWIRLQQGVSIACSSRPTGTRMTTHYEATEAIKDTVWEMFVDWLAAGVDPGRCMMFIQSRVPEHAELAPVADGHAGGPASSACPPTRTSSSSWPEARPRDVRVPRILADAGGWTS